MNKILIGFLALIVAINIFTLRKISGHLNVESTKDTIYVVKQYDSTIHQMSQSNMVYFSRDSVVYHPIETDSVALNQIFKSWFTFYKQEQTFRDSNLQATIIDSIGQNRVLSRSIEYKILRPDSIFYIERYNNKKSSQNCFYPGLSAYWRGANSPIFGPAIFFNRDRFGFYAGAGIGESPVLNFGVHFKLNGNAN